MMYKTELHAHSAECSECALFSAERVTEEYIKAGYTTLVLTNHFKRYETERLGSYERCAEMVFESAERARRAAAGRLNVLGAVEIGLNTPRCDYLVYGATLDFLLEDKDIYSESVEELYRRTTEVGAILIQAHPFRDIGVPANPEFLDGYEIRNGSNRPRLNNMAKALWRDNIEAAPIATSGTDYHGDFTPINSGIVTEEPIVTMEQLKAVLRSGNYTLIGGEK